MEQTILDSANNTITFAYDDATDVVTVKNPAVDNDFHEVTRGDQFNPDMVLQIAGTEGENSWESWSDENTRVELANFWLANKKNQE